MLEQFEKQVFLAGADAIVGLSMESSLDHQYEREYSFSVMAKVDVSGTAVRLAGQDLYDFFVFLPNYECPKTINST